MNAFVLAAFQRHGTPAPLVGLFTGDEEIGSPFSTPVIEAAGRDARAVFNAEPGRPGNKVVIGRKGCMFFRLDVAGKAAHAGANFGDGVSAIEEIARKIVELHGLTDLSKGLTVNVGVVSGGQTVNTVAPSASAEFDLRFKLHADRDAARAKIERIVARRHLPHAVTTLSVLAEFLPLVQSAQSRELYEHYVTCARELGQDVEGIETGGAADSGFTASVGAPTLCATGPVGARAHSPEEYVEIETLVPRAQAVALAILRLPPA
jgi:glutamate carboxypeptidase